MKFVIGSDHRGFLLKNKLKSELKEFSWIDVGSHNPEMVDYPLIGHLGIKMIIEKKANFGILICGSGIGMSIVANRYHGIRAALVWSKAVAKQSKEHDNANVLVLPADYVSFKESIDYFYAWHTALFLNERYQRRIEEIEKLL